MSEAKYGSCLVTEPGPYVLELQGTAPGTEDELVLGVKGTHLMTSDGNTQEDFFCVDCSWLWSGAAAEPAGESHVHEFDHVIGIIGGYPEDPHDLQGEISIWLDGNEETFSRSALLFVPAGVPHGPFHFKRITRPVFFITVAMTPTYTYRPAPQPATTGEKRYTVIDRTKENFSVGGDYEHVERPKSTTKGARILHIEDDIVPGAFYVDFVWIFSGTGAAPAPEHVHEWPELIAFAGADPENPRNNGGEMSIILGDEYHRTNRSALVCIPKGLKHCPWEFHDIKVPNLNFSAGPQGQYTGSHKKK